MSTNSLSNLFVYFGIFLAAFNLVLFSIALTQNKMKSKISNVALFNLVNWTFPSNSITP